MEKAKVEAKREVWDCGSSLYDSFELKSLQHSLHSAISGRTMSMPHLSGHRQPPLPPPPRHHKPTSKKGSRISRSLQKLLRSVFRPKQSHSSLSKDGAFYVYDTSGALSTIPEVPEMVPEFDGLSPEMKSFVTRSRSDRFMPASLGISCA